MPVATSVAHGCDARRSAVTLRVSGGTWRGLRLRAPSQARPTQERVREALFSRWGSRVEGSDVLDLYAGSGVVGVEALSRGAKWCGFVDERSESLRVVEHNLRHCGASATVAAMVRRRLPEGLERLPAEWPRAFDLVFADPPYAFRRYGALLAAISLLLAPGAELVVEHSARVEVVVPDQVLVSESRRYGDTVLSFVSAAPDPDRHDQGKPRK
ncbi:MAG TPA: 16S rRNA (guanine(966)-N(2))-methyltransferase RsmD [Thermoanaerobaculia bacterium]|nr:16S rRNA (guanine(966)-N(2))-methyltransferase RsmD [Thermoanaerobaculia bacterium]